MVSHFKTYTRTRYLSTVLIFFATQTAEASFYEDKARGWFWYEDLPNKKKLKINGIGIGAFGLNKIINWIRR